MELQYEKALKEHNLQITDLPEDARTGIREIKNSLNLMALSERKGKKVSANAVKKLKAMDKWVYYEILDVVNDTDNNKADIPFEQQDVIDDLKNDNENNNKEDNNNKPNTASVDGNIIESELKKLYESGKKEFSLNDLKAVKNVYNLIFDTYDNDGENGVETTNYSLIETSKEVFTLTKK